MKIWHLVNIFQGAGPLAERQEFLFQAAERIRTENVELVGIVSGEWNRSGWRSRRLSRTSENIEPGCDKPYLKDLFSIGGSEAQDEDWLLFTNSDCVPVPTLYEELANMQATVVEYQRFDVENQPRTLDELYSFPGQTYLDGIDGLAIRSGFFRDWEAALPDFILGEPWWDPAYSWTLRNLVPVRRLRDRLRHSKHEIGWDLANPSRTGAHNRGLFDRGIEEGSIGSLALYQGEDSTDTAVVTTLSWDSGLPLERVTRALEKQRKQDLYVDHFLLELLAPGERSLLPEELLERFHHVVVELSDDNPALFQKGALANIGWKKALLGREYRYFIFTDSDVFSEDVSWFRKIRQRLCQDPTRLVHGFRWATEESAIAPPWLSLGAAFRGELNGTVHPGMAWGVHRKMLLMGDGFNPYCLDRTGESAFVREYLNHPRENYDSSLDHCSWYAQVQRLLPFRGVLDAVDVDIVRCHRRPASTGHGEGFGQALSWMRPLHRLLALDGKGLVAWREPDCRERDVLDRMRELADAAVCADVFAECGLEPLSGTGMPAISQERPIPDWPSESSPFVVAHRSALDSRAALEKRTIFTPSQVPTPEFVRSWCDQVETRQASQRLPIEEVEAGLRLILQPKPEASFMVCVVAFRYDWAGLSLEDWETLHLSLRSSRPCPDLFLSLLSLSQDASEVESRAVSLSEFGMEDTEEHHLCLPLQLFQGPPGFEFNRVRSVKLIGMNPARVEIGDLFLSRGPWIGRTTREV